LCRRVCGFGSAVNAVTDRIVVAKE
jgi:hypothetical protein